MRNVGIVHPIRAAFKNHATHAQLSRGGPTISANPVLHRDERKGTEPLAACAQYVLYEQLQKPRNEFILPCDHKV